MIKLFFYTLFFVLCSNIFAQNSRGYIQVNNSNMIGNYDVPSSVHISDWMTTSGHYDTTNSSPELRYQYKRFVPNWTFFGISVGYDYKLFGNLNVGGGLSYNSSSNFSNFEKYNNFYFKIHGNIGYEYIMEKLNNMTLLASIQPGYSSVSFHSSIIDSIPGYDMGGNEILEGRLLEDYATSFSLGFNFAVLYPIFGDFCARLDIGFDYGFTYSALSDHRYQGYYLTPSNQPTTRITTMNPSFIRFGLGVSYNLD